MKYNSLTVLSKAFFPNNYNTDKINFQNICDKIDLFKNKSISMTNENEINSVLRAKEALSNIYATKPCEVDFIDQDTRGSIARMVATKNQNMLNSLRGKYILSKADEFHIPYDINQIDWLNLISEINSYELLIKEANEINLDWDYGYYDPVGLEQAVINHEELANQEKYDVYSYFYATRGLEN